MHTIHTRQLEADVIGLQSLPQLCQLTEQVIQTIYTLQLEADAVYCSFSQLCQLIERVIQPFIPFDWKQTSFTAQFSPALSAY